MTDDGVLPLGRDCECGHPLVWRHGERTCAVYGSHPIVGAPRHLPMGGGEYLVALCMAAEDNSERAIQRREYDRERRARNRHLKAVS